MVDFPLRPMPKDPTFDWTQFRLGIYIQARTEDVFALWTQASGLCRWFLRTAEFAASDGPPAEGRRKVVIPPFDELASRGEDEPCRHHDRYRWEWHYAGGVVGEEWIREIRPPTKLVFGFGDRMEVAVGLRKRGRFCEVDLRQYHIPTAPRARHDLHMGCRVAWAFFLTNLKSVAEGGLDLRETEQAKVRQLHLVNI